MVSEVLREVRDQRAGVKPRARHDEDHRGARRIGTRHPGRASKLHALDRRHSYALPGRRTEYTRAARALTKHNRHNILRRRLG